MPPRKSTFGRVHPRSVYTDNPEQEYETGVESMRLNYINIQQNRELRRQMNAFRNVMKALIGMYVCLTPNAGEAYVLYTTLIFHVIGVRFIGNTLDIQIRLRGPHDSYITLQIPYDSWNSGSSYLRVIRDENELRGIRY
jgi:hypothetical protein